MKPILLVVGVLVLAYMAYGTYGVSTFGTQRKISVPDAAATRGQEPWAEKERYEASGRDNVRRSVIAVLEQPWASFCSEAGHGNLVSGLSFYYGQRDQQLTVYTKLWGEAGARHSIQNWATAEDSRIERLTQEAYRNGYFKPEEVQSYARRPIAEALKGERPIGHPCSG